MNPLDEVKALHINIAQFAYDAMNLNILHPIYYDLKVTAYLANGSQHTGMIKINVDENQRQSIYKLDDIRVNFDKELSRRVKSIVSNHIRMHYL